MVDSSVHDYHILHSGLDGCYAALDLGNHARGNHSAFKELVCLGKADFRNQCRRVILVLEDSGYVGHKDEPLGFQGSCDVGCGSVGIDVVGVAVLVASQCRDYRNIAFFQNIRDSLDVDLGHFAHIAELLILHFGFDEISVHAAKSYGFSATLFKHGDKSLVDLSCKDHLDDVHGLLVGDSQAVDEFGLLAELVHHACNLRSASVNQNDLYSDEPQKDYIIHDLLLQIGIDHGVSAVFNNDGLSDISFDVWKGLGQNFCSFGVGK